VGAGVGLGVGAGVGLGVGLGVGAGVGLGVGDGAGRAEGLHCAEHWPVPPKGCSPPQLPPGPYAQAEKVQEPDPKGFPLPQVVIAHPTLVLACHMTWV